MKKLLVLSMMAFLVLGTSVAFGFGGAAWCQFWPGEGVEGYVAPSFYRYAPTDGSNFAFCGEPLVTLHTYAFVHGWSKILVEHTDFFWEIFKYPADSVGVLNAELTMFGVSSNSGGVLTLGFEEKLNFDADMWVDEGDLPHIIHTPIPTIPVKYFLQPFKLDEDEDLIPSAPQIELTPDQEIDLLPCSYMYQLSQQIEIDSKQPKGVYWGSFDISFQVTCFDAQDDDPFRPRDWDDYEEGTFIPGRLILDPYIT